MENRKFLIKKRIRITLLWLYLLYPLWISAFVGLGTVAFDHDPPNKQWVVFHGDEITGTVVDAETGNPIKDVIIIAQWSTWEIWGEGSVPFNILLLLSPFSWIDYLLDLPRNLGSGKTIVAETDKDGKYKTSPWWSIQPWTYRQLGSSTPRFCIYKPGYKTLWYSYKWMMNDKEISADVNSHPLTKSLTAQEFEKDFDFFQREGLFGLIKQERLKVVCLIEKALKDLPSENTKAIRKYFKK